MSSHEAEFRGKLVHQVRELMAPALQHKRQKKTPFTIENRWLITARSLNLIVAQCLQPDLADLEILVSEENIMARRRENRIVTPISNEAVELLILQAFITDLTIATAEERLEFSEPDPNVPEVIPELPHAVNWKTVIKTMKQLFESGQTIPLGYTTTNEDRILAQINKPLYRVHSHTKDKPDFLIMNSDNQVYLTHQFWHVVGEATTLDKYFTGLGITPYQMDIRHGFSIRTLQLFKLTRQALIENHVLPEDN